ncbi:MAG: TldD/PmbA family protein [Candidatus Bathyarchaeia archaeon]
MEGEIEMHEFLDYALKCASKENVFQIEALATKSEALIMAIEKSEVKTIECKSDKGLGVRVITKKLGKQYVGSAFTLNLSKDSIREAVKNAVHSSKFRRIDFSNASFPNLKAAQSIKDIYDSRILNIDLEQLAKIGQLTIESAAIDDKINSINGRLMLITYWVYLANSLGLQAGYPATIYNVSIEVVAQNLNGFASGEEDYVNRIFNEEKTYQTARVASLTALSQLNPKQINTGVMDVILAPEAISELFTHVLCQEVRADIVQKNQSPLKGKLNQEVSSNLLTIIDDGKVEGAVGSKPYDDEGVPTESKTIIDKGVLKSYLYDSFSAIREGKNSTGNALRPSSELIQKHVVEPQPALTNLIIKPGVEGFDSLIKDVKEGVYIKNVIGAHTSNAVTGEFSIAASTAYKIEDGEVKFPVKNIMLGGNILEILKKIDGIGKIQKQCQSFSIDTSIITPCIKIKEVAISG